MEHKQTQLGFAQTKLPWLIAAGGLVIFLVTLNTWINVRSLPIVSKVTGWDWTPPLQLPLFYFLTYPLRFLPEGILPIVLNVLTAVCSACTLWLLARSVSLLPHDRTHEQRIRERSEFSLLTTKWSWLPPLFAAAICGLQLTFWEHSTAATGEALDLLVFAYCIRCLLEYRINPKESWLIRLAFVYGLGATNNWGLIGFFPLFLAAILWIRGISFFRFAFLVRMFITGVAGLTLYFFIPILWAGYPENSFGEILQMVLSGQKRYLGAQALRQPAMVLALTSILPVIVMGIRWPSSFGDTSAFGAMLTNILFRVVHLTFLGACLWMAFDQAFSPRRIGLRLPFLTFYYLGALAIGYYSAYALLVFTEPPRKTTPQSSAIMKLFNPIVRAAVFFLAIAAPIALVIKNYPAIRAGDGRLIRDLASMTAEFLPKGRTYVISDDAFQTVIMRGFLNKQGTGKDYILVDSKGLENPKYHQELTRNYGDLWPKLPAMESTLAINPMFVQSLVSNLVRSNKVVYLHPSFGYYFEKVYQITDGMIHDLAPYEQEMIFKPGLTPEQVQKNNAFWSKTEDLIQRLNATRNLDSIDPLYVSQIYSRALNNWGVEVQRFAKPEEARPYFTKAVYLNTNNIPATINLDFNQKIAAGTSASPSPAVNFEEKLGTYRTWSDALRENGPFDDTVFALEVGRIFIDQGHFRQGLHNLFRVIHFQPTNFNARVLASRGLIYGGWPGKGLEQIRETREKLALSKDQQVHMINLESVAYYTDRNKEKAEQVLDEAEKTFPDNPILLSAKFDLYRASGDTNRALAILDHQLQTSKTNVVIQLQKAEMLFTMERYDDADRLLAEIIRVNPSLLSAILYKAFVAIQTKKYEPASELVDRALKLDPENHQALFYKAIIQMENKKYDDSVATLNLVLDEDKQNFAALRNRAIVYLRAERLDEAKQDYEHLAKLTPTSFAVHYGLGQVAERKKDYKDAIKHYELYLTYFDNTGAESNKELAKERQEVEAKLQQLKAQQK